MTTYYLGTRDGLYRYAADGHSSGDERTGPTRVSGPTGVVSVVADGDTVYCLDGDGVSRRSRDADWEPLEVPTDDPTHLAVDETGVVVGGSDPLAVHTAPDGQEWTTTELPELAPARRWIDDERVVVSEAGGRVSDTVRTAAGLAVAVERTGVLHLHDGAWSSHHRGLAEDVHDLRRTPDEWLAATGQGLYATDALGEPWRRRDTGQLFQGYSYFHGFARHDGVLYTSGGRHVPGGWPGDDAEALVFWIGGERNALHAAQTPDTTEYVWALTSADGALYAGTATADVDASDRATGVVYRRDEGGWETVCRVPSPVVSITLAD
ncbi:hypothetical protein [Halobaculum sp. MBLA0143]|uniref:hypothetical protein n=1 Tax=Halobaculum sp. MBLA0143 TaxID=3079933 RepID=UPI003525C050